MVKSYKNLFERNQLGAIKYLDLLLDYDPYLLTAWNMQGFYYNNISQYGKAIHCFEKAFEIDKQWGSSFKWPRLYTWSGFAYHKLGNHDREREIYEMGLNVIPDWHGIFYRQAVCALSQNDTAAAKVYIAKYKSKRVTDGIEEYWINYWIGRIYMEAEVFDKAMDIFRELAVINPQNPWAKWRLGFILINNEVNVEEGMNLNNQALEIYPENPDFLYTCGIGLYKKGKLKEAFEVLNRSWELRYSYYHEHYLILREVEQALASKNQ